MNRPQPSDPPFELTPDAAGNFAGKASAFRGVLEVLASRGQLAAVRARVPPEVQPFVDAPPMAITWMPGGMMQRVQIAYAEVAGLDAVRTLGHDSMMRGPFKTMKPMIEGLVRLFGAEPMAFYRRTPSILASQLRGVVFEVAEAGPRAATVTVTYAYARHVPLACFVYWEGVFGVTWEVCRVKGLAQTTRLDEPGHNRGRLDLSWTK